VTVGSGRRPRLSPAYPLFISPGVRTGAHTPGPHSPTPRATPPGRLPIGERGARTTAPTVGGRGGMPYWAPAPLLAHRARLAGPPRTRGKTPGPRCRVNRTATARSPLRRRGRPHDPGQPSMARTGAAPGPHTGEPGG